MAIWIDRMTGTWGDADDLVIVDTEIGGAHMDNDGGDHATFVSTLDDASDSEIIEIAEHSLQYSYGVALEGKF